MNALEEAKKSRCLTASMAKEADELMARCQSIGAGTFPSVEFNSPAYMTDLCFYVLYVLSTAIFKKVPLPVEERVVIVIDDSDDFSDPSKLVHFHPSITGDMNSDYKQAIAPTPSPTIETRSPKQPSPTPNPKKRKGSTMKARTSLPRKAKITCDDDNVPSNDTPSNDMPSDDPPSDDPPSNEMPSDDPPSNDMPSNATPSNNTPSNDKPSNKPPSNETPSNDEIQNQNIAEETADPQTGGASSSDQSSGDQRSGQPEAAHPSTHLFLSSSVN